MSKIDTDCEDCQGESCNSIEIFEVEEENGEEENFDLQQNIALAIFIRLPIFIMY